MQVQRFRVYATTPAGTPAAELAPSYDVMILPADRMKAERASTTELPPSQRGANAAKLHPNTWVLLWLWCAATREGHTGDTFTGWAPTVLDYDRLDANGELVVDDDDDTEEAPTVDPTNGAVATT